MEVEEGLNESFISSTEKGSKASKSGEREGEKEQQEEEEEEVVQRGTPLIFLAVHRSRRSVAGSPGETGRSPVER